MRTLNTILGCTTLSSAADYTTTSSDIATQTAEYIDEETRTIIVSSTSSIVAAIPYSLEVKIVHDAFAYVESLSNDELMELEERLMEKDFEIEKLAQPHDREQEPKTYIKQ